MSIKTEDVKIVTRYSEALKRKIVEEVSLGVLTAREAKELYGISSTRTINRWIQVQGKQSTKIVRVMMKSEKERIRELEQAVADLEIRDMVRAAQLESYQRHVPDLKKKLSTKELKEFEENEEKIKKFR